MQPNTDNEYFNTVFTSENENMLSEIYTKRLQERLDAESECHDLADDNQIKGRDGKKSGAKRRRHRPAVPPGAAAEAPLKAPEFTVKARAHAMSMAVNFFLHEEMWLASDELRDRRTAALSQAASFAKVVAFDDRVAEAKSAVGAAGNSHDDDKDEVEDEIDD
jgi:hypothetical protein